MAWSRDTSTTKIGGSSLYAYTEVDWYVEPTRCSYTHIGGVTSPFGGWANSPEGTLFYREWGGSSWGSWVAYKGPTSKGYAGPGDMEILRTTDAWTRLDNDREIQLACDVYAQTSSGSGTGSAWIYYRVPHKAGNITGLTASRVSDNQVNLSWTNPATAIDGVEVQVSINGAAWATVTTLGSASSYQYTQATADHTYAFRVRATYQSSAGAYAESSAVTMAPAPPASISVAATIGTNVTVTLDNPSEVATSTSYQLSADGQTWAGSEVTGQSTTSFSVNMGTNHYIRVKNVNATGASAWLVSGYIQTVTKPNPPNISASMQTWDVASDLVVSWVGSYPDGSSQTAYKYRTRKNGGAWSETTVNPSTATSLTLTPAAAGVSVGDTFSVSVATKGAAADYSDYPAELVIQVAQKPTVYVTSPAGSPQATIQTMPIEVRATFSDTGNTCEAATCTLKQGTAELYSEAMAISNGALSCDISEFLPDNNAAYTLEVYAISSTGLSQTAVVPFATDFVEPQAGELQITNDPETGYVSLLATFDNSASEITYTGSTNEQYASEPAFVKSLEVQGQSIIRKSKNLIPLKFYDGIGYNKQPGNQLTITDATGVTQSGDVFTRSVGSWGGFGMISEKLANGTYKLSGSVYSTGMRLSVYVLNADFTVSRNLGNYSSPSSITLTHAPTLAGGECYVAFHVGSNIAGDVSITAPQLEAGTTATAYEEYFPPYIESISSVSVGDGTITNPLRSAGSVHDTLMADADSWTVGRKVGVVDLGTLTWTVRNGVGMQTGGLSSLIKSPSANDQLPNVMMPNATPMTWTMLVNSGTSSGGVGVSGGYLAISTTETNAATFKTAMSGVMLFYELATPTTDTETSMSRIDIGSAFTVATDLDSTFSMTTWDGSADAVSISVSRVNADGTSTPLLTDGASGSGLVDRYAPLNTPYQYAVTTTASTQAVKVVYFENEMKTPRWFAYWGDKIAWARWNPKGGVTITRPEKKRVHYVGRTYPVSYDSLAIDQQNTLKVTSLLDEWSDGFADLMRDGGRGVYKGADGSVFWADFEYSTSADYASTTRIDEVSLTITRIDGEKL